MNETTGQALRLLKRGQKSIWRLLISRTGVVTLVLAFQIVLLVGLMLRFQEFLAHYVGVYLLVTIVMVRSLFNSRENPTVKMTWLVVLAVFPIAGAMFYVFTKSEVGHRMLHKKLMQVEQDTAEALEQPEETARALEQADPRAASMARYVRGVGHWPVYEGTDVTYFPSGEAKFRELLRRLEQAEQSIFLEYFIVDEGVMWGSILEVLARKAAQGVDVRVMYDGSCEFYLLPRNYPKKLAALGIQCRQFSPVTPFLSTHYNYRDHRKILVIDGKVAFTGGVNLADEYINVGSRFGHWKDSAVMLTGSAVRSFTLMFLQMWSAGEEQVDYGAYLNSQPCPEAKGFVMPYGDTPLDNERMGEQVYLDLLQRAQKYVHITTPYLIIDGEMENALRYCAHRGVQVQLIVPGTPDNKSAHALAKTHFPSLLEAGVEVYLYDPGFIHAKSFVCDDREAVVGTINLDYRSLYHHFECAVWMYDTDAVADVERDFQETVAKCSRVTKESLAREKFSVRWLGQVLKFLAPLL